MYLATDFQMATHKHVTVSATVGPSYGTSNYGYNQPLPQQYPGVAPPSYPTGQQYPPYFKYVEIKCVTRHGFGPLISLSHGEDSAQVDALTGSYR